MKIKTMGIALLALAAMASCSKGGGKGSDSDSVTPYTDESSELAPAPADSLGAVFADPSKKSDAATDSTYAVTASGLKYMVLREGNGEKPGPEDMVTVHYTGQLLDGTVFDSSYNRGEPTAFPLNRVIPGWTEGLQLMSTGGKAVFYIPSDLAYGPQGAGGMIPPNADLIFTVELLGVEKAK